MPQGKKRSAVDIFEQGRRQGRKPSAVDIFEQSQAPPPPVPQGSPAEPQGAFESFGTELAGKFLQYGIKPGAALANAISEASGGNFQPLKDIAESAGRGALNLASAFDPTGAAYEPTVASQAQRMQELRQAEEARLPENVRLMERGYQVEAAKPRTTAGQVAGIAGGLIGAGAPIAATAALTGGSLPAVAATAALQSAAEPENLALNVGSAVVPIPIGKLVAPIIRRIRGNKAGVIQPEILTPRPNPEGLAMAIGEDAFDAGKVKVTDLGLEHVSPPTRPASAIAVKREIPVTEITLGRDELSKGRMFQVEQALQQGVKREGETFTTLGGKQRPVQPITVVPDPKKPGKWIVEDDGNHRVALLKMQGYAEPIPVRSYETPAQSQAVVQAVEYRPPTTLPELEAAPPEPFEVSLGSERPRVPGAVGPRITEYGVVERMASQGSKARELVGAKAQADFALEDGTLVAPAEKTPVSETITALRKAGLLTAVNTHLRNIAGTGVFQISEEAARIPASIADLAISAATGRRTISGPSLSGIAKSGYEAATKGIKEAGEIIRNGASADDLAKLQLTQLNSGSKILDGYVNGVFRLLSAEDRVFRTYALRRSLEDRAKSLALTEIKQGKIPQGQYGQRIRDLVDAPPEDILAGAISDAEIATFNNENVISKMVSGAKQAATQYLGPKGGRLVSFAIDTAAPFTKTPTNIIARMLEYSPVGFGKNAYQVAKGVANKAFTAEEQRAFAQTFGRATIGSALITAGWKLYDAGIMTGLYEDEPGKRTREQAAGRIPGAIRIGDTWHQLIGFAPFGNLLAIGASLAREYEQEREDQSKRYRALLNVAGSALGEQPLLEATKQLSGAFSRPGATAGQLAGSFIPSAVANVGELIDTSQRQAEGFLPQIEKRLPGLRETLPVATDVLGRPLEDRATQIVDPTRSTTATQLPILKELVRLDVGLNKLKKQPGQSDADYRDKVSRFGSLYQEYGAALLSNPQYQRATDKQKKEALDSLSNRAKAQVTDETQNKRRAENPRLRLDPRLIMTAILTKERRK